MSENASVTEVSDIGDVVSSDSEDDEIERRKCIEGEITAVLNVTKYSSCFNCKAKVNNISEVIGQCSKCDAIVKMSKCENSTSVRFVVEDSDHDTTTLTAFTDMIDSIVSGETGCSIAEKMLSAQPMKFYVTNNIIKAVSK